MLSFNFSLKRFSGNGGNSNVFEHMLLCVENFFLLYCDYALILLGWINGRCQYSKNSMGVTPPTIVDVSEYTTKDLKWLRACVQAADIFSTCVRRRYASFIVAKNGRVIGFGYNGSPPGYAHCDEGACPRAFSDVKPGSRYDIGEGRCIAVHAEANALLYSDTTDRQSATLYVNGPPCPDCAKLIAGSGVKRVVHLAADGSTVNHLEEMGVETISVPPDNT